MNLSRRNYTTTSIVTPQVGCQDYTENGIEAPLHQLAGMPRSTSMDREEQEDTWLRTERGLGRSPWDNTAI